MRWFLVPILAALPAAAQSDGVQFEANLGQAEAPVLYLGRARGGAVAFTRTSVRFPAAQLHFAGGNPAATWETADTLASTTSYYIGNDPARWITGARHYGRLIRRGTYPGIDAVFYGRQGDLEFDFAIAPHADPRQIRLAWSPGTRLHIDSSGNLIADTPAGSLALRKPVAFQMRDGHDIEVPVRFSVNTRAGEAGFELGDYDPAAPLVIDPTVERWSYLGGSGSDRILAAARDVLAGVTNSAGITPFSPTPRGKDIFIRRGDNIQIYGGSADEEPTSIVFLGDQLLVAGWTSSRDFPMLGAGSMQRQYGGGARDGFFILNPGYDGRSSYLGGSGDDVIAAAASDLTPSSRSVFSLPGFYLVGETNSPDFPVRAAVQPQLAGGRDGFVTHILGEIALAESTYWGGAGDDAVLAVDAIGNSCWFAGRTTSTDLRVRTPLQEQPGGAADGFLARLDGGAAPAIGFATYLGGSGNDEVRALRIAPDGWIWTGGTTGSADLPLRQPSQASYGGGAADAWVGRFHAGTGLPSFVTYLGGSGNDELRSIAHDGNGELYVAGWTDSGDLRVVDALQERVSGGEDGFLARLNRYGDPQMLTYVGGGRNDRLHAVSIDRDQRVTAAGESESPAIAAFPGKPAVEAAGDWDGFYFTLRPTGIFLPDFYLGKDLQVSLQPVVVGESLGPLTITSSDPSLVALSQGAIGFGPQFGAIGNAAEGQAEVTIFGAGLPTRKVLVTLRPSYAVNSYTDPVEAVVDVQTEVSVATAITHPDSGVLIYQNPRNDDVGLSFYSSDPGILQVRSGESPTYRRLGASVRGVVEGEAAVRIASSRYGLLGPNEIRVRVQRTRPPFLTLKDVAVGRLLQTALPIQVRPGSVARESYRVRFTSEDPSRVLLSAKAADRGSDSVTIDAKPGNSSNVWVQGRASSGVVRLKAELEGAEPVYVNVALAQSIVALAGPSQVPVYGESNRDLTITTATLESWTVPRFAVYVAVNGPVPPGFTVGVQVPSPESQNKFSVSSNNGAVSLPSLSIDLVRDASLAIFSPALEPGTTEISVVSPDFPSNPPLQVTKRPTALPLRVTEIVLGKDLQTSISLATPADFPLSTITITSGDPARLRVGGYTDEETSQITVRSSPVAWFWVSALASSGDVPITVSAPGFPARTILVHLAETSFRLTPSSATVPLGGFVWTISVQPTFPGAVQDSGRRLRPSFSANFTVTSSDPSVLDVMSPTFTLNSYTNLQALTRSFGVAELTLTATTPGVLLDSSGTRATVTVVHVKAPRPTAAIALGKNLQRPLFPDFRKPYEYQTRVTLRSEDPSRVLLAQGPTSPGVESLEMTDYVHVQALADSGEAYIVASAPGYEDWRIRVVLYPTALGFFAPYENPVKLTGSAGSSFTLTVTAMPFDAASGTPIYAPGMALRNGLEPFEARIRTSDPAVGRLFSPLGFAGGMSENRTEFRAEANGTTDLSIEPPDGFVDGGPLLRRRIEIGATRLSIAGITLGKDMQVAQSVSGAWSQAVLTITSSDPSRVLVSASPSTPGQASVIVTAQGIGSSTPQFYTQALESSGDVTLTVTAPGYEPATATVHLEPSYFSFAAVGSSTGYPENGIYRGTLNKTIYLTHASAGFGGNKVLRAGAGTVTVPVETSDASVIAARTPIVLREGVGQAYATFAAGVTGSATLRIEAPAGFTLAPDQDRILTVNVNLRTFSSYIQDVPMDRVKPLSNIQPIEYAAGMRFVSADPSRVLLSTDPAKAGTAEVAVDTSKPQTVTVYAHALASSGTVDVTASAEGFETATIPVRLQRSGFIFLTDRITLKPGQVGTVRVSTAEYSALRPGAGVTLAIDNTNAAVATAGSIQFQGGDIWRELAITAKAPGTAVLTLREGFPSATINLVVTVSAN